MTDNELLKKYCNWLFIPQGWNGDSLKVAGRLMFDPAADYPHEHATRLSAIFSDWPRYLARRGWTAEVAMDRSQPEVLTKIDLASAFSPKDLEARSEIWKAAFPQAGEVMTIEESPSVKDHQVLKLSEVAREITSLYGSVHTMAIAGSGLEKPELATQRGHQPFNFSLIRQEAIARRSAAFTAQMKLPSSLTQPLVTSARKILEQVKALQVGLDGPADRGIKAATVAVAGEGSPVLKFLEHHAPTSSVQAAVRARRDVIRLSREMQQIAHHGWLLRYLGLVVDFEITDVKNRPLRNEPAPQPRGYLPGIVVVDGTTGWPAEDPAGRGARNRDSIRGLPQAGGIVRLNAESSGGERRFALMQLNVASSAHKLRLAAQSSLLSKQNVANPGQEAFEPSSQVTGGLTLVDRAAADARPNANRYNAPGAWRRLFAEDITLGIRPDVQCLAVPETGRPVQGSWKSLTRWKVRAAHVQAGPFQGALAGEQDVSRNFRGVDAGEAVVGSSYRRVDGADGSVARSTEELFTWDGWSMAVPHPDPGNGGKPVFATLRVNKLVVELEAGGGLPALRVGHGYRFGARAVYLDGGGLPLEQAVKSHYNCEAVKEQPLVGLAESERGVVGFFPYMRFEPLVGPDLHLADRIDYARFPQASAQKIVVASSRDPSRVEPKSARIVVPPAVSLEQAVALGMYDSAARRTKPPESAFHGVCLTRAGRIPNVSSDVMPTETGSRRSTSGDGADTIFHRSSFARTPVVPYLPDPWARRVIAGVFRASDGELLKIGFHDYYPEGLDMWPHCVPLQFEVRRSSEYALSQLGGSQRGEVHFEKTRELLRLVVPPGENLRVHFWHEVDDRILRRSGIVDQMAAYLVSPDGSACCEILQITGCSGKHTAGREQLIACLSRWEEMRDTKLRAELGKLRQLGLTNVTTYGMINPTEILDVVHAVDRPLPPKPLWSGLASEELETSVNYRLVRALPADSLNSYEQSVRIVREARRSEGVLAGDIRIDRVTTDRLDISLAWRDVVDDLQEPGPTIRERSEIVSLDQLLPVLPHPVDIDRNRLPNNRATPDVPEDNHLVLLDGVRTKLGRRTNEDLRGRRSLVAFGDTRARAVDLSVVAHSRHAAEFNGPRTSCISPPGKLEQIVCLSTAPPRKPEIDYVMPLYRWRENRNGHRSHERIGGWFRIWLKRPWFSSGIDERLALVCWPPALFDKEFDKSKIFSGIAELCRSPQEDPPPFLEGMVTRWGLDPLWSMERAGACIRSVSPDAFRQHICDGRELSTFSKRQACFPVLDLRKCVAVRDHLASYQAESAKVALVLYEPKYDEASRRYFVDVQIDESYAYTPFMRLALARYQEHAVPGHELSEIVTHEFIQLPPSRSSELSIQHDPTNAARRKLTVSLKGAAPGQANASGWTTEVKARLEYLPLKTWESHKHLVPGELGLHGIAWVPDEQSVATLPRDVRAGRWAGAMQGVELSPERIYSVVIEEYEIGLQDADASPGASLRCEGVGTPTRCVRRRVFSDRLLVSPP